MTIREIAAIAGRIAAAVSLVMNNKKGVSEETRRRVMSVVEECGYAPALQKKKVERFRLMVLKFRAHGIALEENQGFVASIIDRIESECRRFAFDIIMCNCEAKTAAATIRELMQNPPDGVIVIGTELREPGLSPAQALYRTCGGAGQQHHSGQYRQRGHGPTGP